MAAQEPPRIEFPCAYPIKVVGEHSDDFASVIVAIVQLHDPAVTHEHVRIRASSQGKYVSLNLTFTARSTEHIMALHADLKASGRVQIVL